MAIDVTFPIYELLVESVFGSIALAMLGVAVALAIILLITRTSTIFLTYWLMFYIVTMSTFYFGVLGLIFWTLLGIGILTYNLIKLWGRES